MPYHKHTSTPPSSLAPTPAHVSAAQNSHTVSPDALILTGDDAVWLHIVACIGKNEIFYYFQKSKFILKNKLIINKLSWSQFLPSTFRS